MARQTGVVEFFKDDKGFGFIRPDDGGKDVFVHHSSIQMEGFRTLSPGQRVDLHWEAPGFKQDGYDYRAVDIVPRPA